MSFVGDVLLARAVPTALARDSATLRRHARAAWAGSRYVVGNLECPLADTARPVRKRYVFQGMPRWAGWLRQLGFTHLGLANNHTLDQHRPGLAATARHLRAAGLGALGYQADSLAGCRPTLLGADSSVAVFAYSAFPQRVAGEGCVCGRDFAALCERLAAYKTLFPARAVLVYLHWGVEYTGQPTPEQRRQARLLIDCGAAAVLGAHPHVLQTMEFYHGRPILYSLGNFLFDQQGHATDMTVQADLDLRDGAVQALYLRPWQLRQALPRPAGPAARAALLARLRQLSPQVQLTDDPATGGWQLRPTGPAEPPSGPGYFARQQQLADSAGPPTALRLRYLPGRQEYHVWSRCADGRQAVLPVGSPLYQVATADVDNDGHADLLLGPEKATHFDRTVRRRLFVYRVAAGRLQPRWLGTRVMHRLLYFRAAPTGPGRTAILTIEQQPNGRYCLGRYHWQGFGLAFDGFGGQELGLDAAYDGLFRPGSSPHPPSPPKNA